MMAVQAPDSRKSLEMCEDCISSVIKALREGLGGKLPTLAKRSLAKTLTNFGQTKFGQHQLWPYQVWQKQKLDFFKLGTAHSTATLTHNNTQHTTTQGRAPGPEGGGPEPRNMRPRRVGPERWGTQKIHAIFLPLPPQFSFFLPSLGGLLVEFGWCFEDRGFARQPENSKRGHLPHYLAKFG